MAQSVSNDALWGKLSEMDKKLDRQSEAQESPVSKEEMETIMVKNINRIGAYFDSKHKEQIENQNKLLVAIQNMEKSIKVLPTLKNIPFKPSGKTIPEPNKIAFIGFEFLRSSVVIFILSVIVFWSLVMNIKQMDNCRNLKAQLYQQTEYILHLQQIQEEAEKTKVKKTK